MLKKEYTLSEVVDYFKRNQIASFEKDIDDFGGYFITAARIAAVIVDPDAITALSNFCGGIDAASLKVSKLFSWLPDKFKYGNKGREKFAIKRYELSSIIYIKLLDLAIANAVNEILIPLLRDRILINAQLTEEDKNEIKKTAEEAEKKQYKITVDTYSQIDEEKIKEIVNNITDPLLHCLCGKIKKGKSRKNDVVKEKMIEDIETAKENLIKKSNLYFNVFLLNLASEFPEFNLWFDFNVKKEITSAIRQYNKLAKTNEHFLDSFKQFETRIKKALKRIDDLNTNSFTNQVGFSSFENTFETSFKVHTDNIINKISEKFDESKRNWINAHHNFIKADIEKKLSDDNTVPEIVYPKNKEIYIAQAYNSIEYIKRKHEKSFLTAIGFDEVSEKGEDIGKFLLIKLKDPNTTFNPIILLGNPGAGKSIFSKHFAEKLCNTNDFVPFLIRLRDVASNSTNVSEHINKGIAYSIALTKDIDWIELAQLFKERIPVVILDGFDELMQSSNVELNNYVNTIKELQKTALTHDICLKVILTSRIAVMQDVSIPEGTTVVKLNPFDDQRKDLWINTWNSFQTKENYKFELPANNKKIQELSQEPLILFMLAIYDFPDSKLLSIANDITFNQSHLYDSLLADFGKRQLEKEDNYLNATEEDKKNEEELFRLRLGMIALLMFLNDTTNKDIKRLDEELKSCKLDESKIKPLDVLTGFFFVHQNKSTEEAGHENFNYEFLHKSFGEFLAADFILRIAKRFKDRKTKDEELFRFCFGYNWLNKHPEIQKFLFEHAYYVFKLEQNEQERIIDYIQESLSKLFDSTLNDFPIPRFGIIDHKSKIEHLAIYSQNLIFLWLSLSKKDDKICFDILPSNQNKDCTVSKDDFIYLAQDRDETNSVKLFWKRICNLWQLIGNNQSVAKLYEWIEVKEETDKIILKKRKNKSELTNNLLQASLVSCNDFNYILSLFDAENKDDSNDIISKLKKIYKQKPELSSLGNDALLFRFQANKDRQSIFDFLTKQQLSKRQLKFLYERFISYGNFLSIEELLVQGRTLLKINDNQRMSIWRIKLMNYLYDRIAYSSQELSFLHEHSRQILHDFEFDDFKHIEENELYAIDYITLIINFNEKFPFLWDNMRLHNNLFRYIERTISHNLPAAIEFIKAINKSDNPQSISQIFPPDFFAMIFDRLFSEKHSLDSDNNRYYIWEFLILLSELDYDFILKNDRVGRFIKESFNYLHLESLLRENPMFTLRYIKALKKIHKKTDLIDTNTLQEISIGIFNKMTYDYSISEQRRKDFNENKNDCFKCMFCPDINCERRNTRYSMENIRIINEISESLPKEMVYNSDLMKLLIFDVKERDFERIHYENPLFALEYLKLLLNFNNEPQPNIIILERDLLEYIHHRGLKNNEIFLELLKILNRQNYRPFRLDDLKDEMIKLMLYNKEIVRKDSEVALECINFLSIYDETKIAFDIFPEFKHLFSKDKEALSLYLQTFYNIFKK
jgi:hypothetical protein